MGRRKRIKTWRPHTPEQIAKVKAAARRHYFKYRDRILQGHKRNVLRRLDARREYERQYRIKNKEKIRQGIALWVMKNKERVTSYRRNWEEGNRDRRCLIAKRYRKRHPEAVIQHNAARRSRQPVDEEYRRTIDAFVRSIKKHLEIRCAYCDKAITRFHIDHIVPLSRGGRHERDNLCVACPFCNLSKGARLLSEWKTAA